MPLPYGRIRPSNGRPAGGIVFKGFREFLLRGNVVDLAVAVVIGTAFTQVVMAFSNAFVKPLITLVTGGAKFGGKFTVADVDFTYGGFLNAVVNFLIAAAVVYFVFIAPMNKIAELRRRGEEPPPKTPSEEAVLLEEIRDLLRAQQK
jgi:large conductance mechanosensitive channel